MKYKRIEWFDQEFTENKLTITIESNGKLRLSKGFLTELPKSIAFGFDKPTRTMFVKEVKGNKGYHPRIVMPVKELPTAIKECGLKLPVRFQFSKDLENNYWVGKILLVKNIHGFDMEQLFVAFEPLINSLVHKLGKSIPKEERRSIVAESICRAAKEYGNIYGDLYRYIKMYVEDDLIRENKYYARQTNEISLDKQVPLQRGGFYSLHDRISGNNSDHEELENKIMNENFLNTLSKIEQIILQMSSQSCPVPQICEKTNLSPEEIIAIAEKIGKKQKAFYRE